MTKIKWGIISTALIGTAKVIPGMQTSPDCEIVAIASRSADKAKAAADKLGIAKAYGSYEAMLADPEIEAVYNPLPNNYHVPVSIQALEAGKHVLCEKPIAMHAAELEALIAARDRTGRQCVEAFMVRHHPQWQRTRELARSGALGRVMSVNGLFCYFNRDPANIRNIPETGGGAMYDIGCYPIVTSRYVFGEEPRRVAAITEYDPDFKCDRLASVLLDYPSGQAAFTVSTQMANYQRMHICGEKARVEVEIPFNAPPDRPCRIFVDDGSKLGDQSRRVEEFPTCDQYGLQGSAVSQAFRAGHSGEFPLEDAVKNMRVIDAALEAGRTGRWVELAA
ncbi:MAG: Gfo/Idh/MocA family oxidoreductase [Alphaproteobacteria bacterium]